MQFEVLQSHVFGISRQGQIKKNNLGIDNNAKEEPNNCSICQRHVQINWCGTFF